MKQNKIAFLTLLISVLTAFSTIAIPAKAEGSTSDMTINSSNAISFASMSEAKYERLMRTYVNKMKLAFMEQQDAKTLEILVGFANSFTTQSEELKNNLRLSAIHLSKAEIAGLNKRMAEKSHSEELFALHFNELVFSRMESNPDIKMVVEALQAKSKELLTAEFLAAK